MSIANKLLTWYAQNKRDLPWRKSNDPYKIWLSEIILQQTRVDQGLPYYYTFVEKYPTIAHLARAPLDDVLRVWQGLGYYSRARNLHECAKMIVNTFEGAFPSTKDELLRLPGIGPYTAAAIASIAFCKKEAVVDGNVIRVITRLYGIADDISDSKTMREINRIADALIPETDPASYNQAIMEFGALYCTPKKPNCGSCMFHAICIAKQKGSQGDIPVKQKKIKKRSRFFNYLIIQIEDGYLLRKRTEKDIWHALFEFFLVETSTHTSFDQLPLPKIMRRSPGMWTVNDESKTYKHLLSHQTIMSRFYVIRWSEDYHFRTTDWNEYRLYSKEEIDKLPKSTLINRYLNEKID